MAAVKRTSYLILQHERLIRVERLKEVRRKVVP